MLENITLHKENWLNIKETIGKEMIAWLMNDNPSRGSDCFTESCSRGNFGLFQ